ncbi:MAG: class I tRNA ligase family protein [Desulfobulbaceae bacterium]|nr:class I tRNA ligase family protein [Desulfobulbaceae bacterium]
MGATRKSGLRLFNTLARRKQLFRGRAPKQVKMFTCGASIYGRPHIGNYRTFLHEDILQRYLEYRGYTVDRCINFTDVEDKSLLEASRRNISLAGLTDPVAHRFYEECQSLGIKLPSQIPRSSTTVDEAVRLIKLLLAKGHAYFHDGDIFFAARSFKKFGKLYGLDMRSWPKQVKRFRRDTYSGQRWNRGDFILWHGGCVAGGDGFCWQTEVGSGRPAWNIQDPAIISKHLGDQVDICCGGIDNLIRHHDYNLAVMESATGKHPFCRYWVHVAHVLINKAKMSKSRGNIVYPDDLYARGYTPTHLRFFLISSYYRSSIHFDFMRLAYARDQLESLRRLADEVVAPVGGTQSGGLSLAAGRVERLVDDFEAAMDDDCHVGRAIISLQGNLQLLSEHWLKGELMRRDVVRLKSQLQKIDLVLRVLYD